MSARLRRTGVGLATLLVALGVRAGEARADQGQLLMTGGASMLEGSAGGGLVPWAVLSGYGTEDGIGGSIGLTRARVDDYTLDVYAGSVTLWNRMEVSLAHHRFDAQPFDTVLRQNVLGLKLRLFGDFVYTSWPQVSAGVQLKHNLDFDLPEAVGARRRSGVDGYLSASKLFLGGFFGYNLSLSGTLRATRANQMGLLGFGGDRRGGHRLVFEGSAALLLNRRTAIGYEYRQKPDNLRFATEDAFQDVFLAYFLNKRLSLVAAYTALGSVATFDAQDGWYLSLQGSF